MIVTFSSFSCIQYDKDTILKAIYNLNKIVVTVGRAVFSMTKIQFWKQFTTARWCTQHVPQLYSVWQRYNFESNLQPSWRRICKVLRCIQYDKDTILKAIYNLYRCRCFICVLYSVWQRYNFESNLQRNLLSFLIAHCCIQYDKDTILKAIYNFVIQVRNGQQAVFSMTKIQFWKQFTTERLSKIVHR